MDDAFTLKEVLVYMGGAVCGTAVLIAGWFWANPMKRISAIETLLTEHIRANALQHTQCEVRILEFKSQISASYFTKTETLDVIRRVEDSVRDGFKEIKEVLKDQNERSDHNFSVLHSKIDKKQDKP